MPANRIDPSDTNSSMFAKDIMVTIIKELTKHSLLTGLLLVLGNNALHAMESNMYFSESTVFSNGTALLSSATYQTEIVMGQQSGSVGIAESDSFTHLAGFSRNNKINFIAAGDVNADGYIDLQDLILSLQITVGLKPMNITTLAAESGNSHIGLNAALLILSNITETAQ